jgi:hypothetical protein
MIVPRGANQCKLKVSVGNAREIHLDEELKQHLQAMEQRLVAMEQRLVAMEQRLAAMEQRLMTYVDKRCERLETNLLTEFQKWASPVEMRLRSHSSVLRTLDMDFEALSDRVKRIEGREPGQAH